MEITAIDVEMRLLWAQAFGIETMGKRKLAIEYMKKMMALKNRY